MGRMRVAFIGGVIACKTVQLVAEHIAAQREAEFRRAYVHALFTTLGADIRAMAGEPPREAG